MEKNPIRERLTNPGERLGQLVIAGMEHMDDALDVYGDPELDDTQEMDLSGLSALLEKDRAVRG